MTNTPAPTPKVSEERLREIATKPKRCAADLPTLGEAVDIASELLALRRSHAQVVAGLRKEYSACIQLAARLANRDGLLQLFPDGHPKPATRGYWLRLLGIADDNSAAKAMDLRRIADRLSALLTTLSPTTHNQD